MTQTAMGVAIVSYNTAPLLRRCLESVVADTSGPVLVVDNQSVDGSAELVRREFPGVQLHAEAGNLGYGAAANLALHQLETRYVLLLNADTQLTPGTVQALSNYLDSNPEVAIAGPRLVGLDGGYQPSAHRFPTPLELLFQESGVRRLLGLAQGNQWRRRSVQWILGAALAIRRDAFTRVGGFDEGYFLYQEEVDLCHRLLSAGWEIHYSPVATVLHIGGASTSQRAAETFAQFVRSTVRFARIRLSRPKAAGVRAVLAAVLLARLTRDAAQLPLALNSDRRARLRHRAAIWRCGLIALRDGG